MIFFLYELPSEIRWHEGGIASNREIPSHGEIFCYFVLTTHQQQEIFIFFFFISK